MKTRSVLCLLMSLIMLLGSISSISASYIDNVSFGNIKITRFENSSQLHGKATDADIVSDFDVNFSLNSSGLQIQGEIENTTFSAVGVLATKNSNNTILAYNAIDTDNNYDILYMCADKETEKLLFLNSFIENIEDYSNVIKLYMQDKNNEDYIMIEIYIEYDFVGNYIANYSVANNEALVSQMFSWFTNHIEAENETEQVSTYSSRQRTYRRAYELVNTVLYFQLTVEFKADIEDICLNSSSISSAYIEVINSVVVDEYGDEYFIEQNALSLKNVYITFITIPNTVIKNQTWIEEGNVATSGQLHFYVRSDSVTAPKSAITTDIYTAYIRTFDFSGYNTSTTGIRLTSTGYNDVNDRTNGVELMSVGDKYGFNVTVQDKVGVAKSDTVMVTFSFDIYCSEDLENNFSDYTSMNVRQTIS